jgi:hypothetical protein
MRSIGVQGAATLDRQALRQGFESRAAQSVVSWHGGAVIRSWREVADHLPGPGANTTLVTCREFSAFEFVPMLLHGPCELLLLTTYNISGTAVGMLGSLLSSGQVHLADVLVHESMRRLSDGGQAAAALADLRQGFPGRFRFRELDIHAKLICMAMASGDAWVVEGSGNMARNTSIELYSVFNDAGRIQFHAGWIGGLL